MILNISYFVFLSFIMFFIGIFGIMLNRRSIVLVLLCIELILLSINLNFIFFSVYLNDLVGQVFSLQVLTVAAAESAIGLAILVLYFRVQNSLSTESLDLIQGLLCFLELQISFFILFINKKIFIFIKILKQCGFDPDPE